MFLENCNEECGETGMSVLASVKGRRSVRRFLDKPVSRKLIHEILSAAARAPSGTNSQPWIVHVVAGEARAEIENAVQRAAMEGGSNLEYPYAPHPWWEPFISRRREVGYALYEARGIERHDGEARAAAAMENYSFFGAPIGMFLMMDRNLQLGSWLDCGIFLSHFMLVARTFGLDTCPQQAWCNYGATVREALKTPDDHILVCGMAIGYPDEDAPVNKWRTKRLPVEEFATFHGEFASSGTVTAAGSSAKHGTVGRNAP